MGEPVFSIIIPVLDRRDLFDKTLRCLRSQTFGDWECIVVDDGSTDGTREMVHEHIAADPRIRWVDKPAGKPKGPSASRNVGLQLARGEFVHFFDSDDLLVDDFYEFCQRRMREGELDFFVTGLRWFFEEGTGDALNWTRQEAHPFVREDFIARGVSEMQSLWTQNVVWRRSLVSSMDGYREDLTQVEDLEFTVRAMLRAQRFDFDDTPRVLIRRHNQSLTFVATREREIARRLSTEEVHRLIDGHLTKSGVATGFSREYGFVERYRHVTWAIRLGLFRWVLVWRWLRLFSECLRGRPALALRLLVKTPGFIAIGCIHAFRHRFAGSRKA